MFGGIKPPPREIGAKVTFASIVELLKGIVSFPNEILRLIQALKRTPQEKHDELLAKIESEAKTFEDTGRPTA